MGMANIMGNSFRAENFDRSMLDKLSATHAPSIFSLPTYHAQCRALLTHCPLASRTQTSLTSPSSGTSRSSRSKLTCAADRHKTWEPHKQATEVTWTLRPRNLTKSETMSLVRFCDFLKKTQQKSSSRLLPDLQTC